MNQPTMVTVSTAEIASLLGCSRQHVTDRLTKEPDFPVPVIDLSNKLRRWDERDVLLWIKKRSQQRSGHLLVGKGERIGR